MIRHPKYRFQAVNREMMTSNPPHPTNSTLPGRHRTPALWTTGLRHNILHAEILDHLIRVVKGVHQGLNHQSQAGYFRACQGRDRRRFYRRILLLYRIDCSLKVLERPN
jgi:hypothetical protein